MFRPRWLATAHYRTDAGPIDITHDLREIAELHGIIERGPPWDAVEKIEVIRVNHNTAADLTVEAAAKGTRGPRCDDEARSTFEPRWSATVYYRAHAGSVDVTHDMEELFELHNLIENGPHWDTIELIEIVRVNHNTDPDMTVEAAREI